MLDLLKVRRNNFCSKKGSTEQYILIKPNIGIEQYG